MKILVFSWREIGNPRAGGAERVTFEHMRRWVADGHNVTLFTASYPGAGRDGELAGIQIVRRGNETTVHLAGRHWYRRQRQQHDLIVDEIHGVPFGALSYAGVPVVGWIHEVGRDIWFRMYPFPIAVVGRLLEVSTLRWYARAQIPFITVSQSTATDLAHHGVRAANITVIQSGINLRPLDDLPEKDPDPTLIIVGRIVPMKGTSDAIHALPYIHTRFPNCRLWIVGAGPSEYVRELKRLASQMRLDETVRFLGRVSEEEKRHLLARAHLLIHPSLREGWGLNVIEANAMGTPAIGYRVPGLSDSIVHGTTGLLCPNRRPIALADAACSLLAAPERYRAMQLSCLERSRCFSWDEAARRSLALLVRLAGPRKRLLSKVGVGSDSSCR